MKLFCKHNWEVLSETTTESIQEQNIRLGGVAYETEWDNVLQKLHEKKHILVVKCTKCGKLKRFIEDI